MVYVLAYLKLDACSLDACKHGFWFWCGSLRRQRANTIQWLRNKQTISPLGLIKFEFLFRKYFTPLHCADYSRWCLVTFILLSMTSTFISLGMQLQPSFSSIIQRGNEPWLYIPPPPTKEVHESL